MVVPDGGSVGARRMSVVDGTRPRVTVRRDVILQRLDREGRVEVGDLAGRLGVTEETIRRDLRALEDRRLLRRAHGGAISLAAEEALPFSQRDGREVMAAAVTGLISEGDAVYLGAGRGCEAVAVLLARRSGIQLIAGSAPVALAAMQSNPAAPVHTIGGTVQADGAFAGMWAGEQLAGLVVDVSVVETEGLAPDGRLLASDPERAAVQAAAIVAGRTIVVLAGQDWLTGSGHVKYGSLAEVDHVVIGSDLSPGDLDRLRESDVDVIRPGSDSES